MDICLISGKTVSLNKIAALIERLSNLNAQIPLRYSTISMLHKDIASKGITFMNNVDVVLLTDNAFGPVRESVDRAKLLREFQDILNAKRYRKKVYLITKDGDLANIMKNPDKMDDNFIYRNFKIVLYEDKLSGLLIKDTLLGEHDKYGISHDDFGVELSKSEDAVIEETLNKLGGGRGETMKEEERFYASNNQNLSAFTKEDYADTPQHNLKRKKDAKNENKRNREENRRRNKLEREQQEQVSKNLSSDVEGFVSPNHIYVSDQQISAYKASMVTQRGVIAVTGNTGSGVSGVVANIAETYNIIDSSVAVLDLDIYKRYQSVYFGDYEEISEEKRGKKMGLVPLVDNYKSSENYGVNVKEMIDVYSISRYDVVGSEFEYVMLERLEYILNKLKSKYDIVILDLPITFLNHIDLGIVNEIDTTLFVSENLTFKIEDLLLLTLRTALSVNKDAMNELLDASYIAYNKYVDGRKGFDMDEKCDGVFIQGILEGLNRPYSKIRYISHIPFDSRWENQITKDERWVERELENEKTMISLLGQISYELK